MRYIATIRIVTATRVVEPGEEITPDELDPAGWAGLLRKGRIVEKPPEPE